MIDEGWRCFVGVPIGEPLDGELRKALGALKAAASASWGRSPKPSCRG
jgi:hypothetical protein